MANPWKLSCCCLLDPPVQVAKDVVSLHTKEMQDPVCMFWAETNENFVVSLACHHLSNSVLFSLPVNHLSISLLFCLFHNCWLNLEAQGFLVEASPRCQSARERWYSRYGPSSLSGVNKSSLEYAISSRTGARILNRHTNSSISGNIISTFWAA